MKYNDNGEYKDIYVKTFDTLPVGTEVDYDGETVPTGWTEIADPNTYSTNEVRIGTWIDGKPLYRKVITDSATTAGDRDISIADISYDYLELVSFNVVVAGTYCLNVYGDQNSNDKIRAFINRNSNNIVWSRGTSWPNASFYGTIQYTKTTD